MNSQIVTLKKILEEHTAHDFQLPPLKTLPGVLDTIMKRWESFLEWLAQYLSSSNTLEGLQNFSSHFRSLLLGVFFVLLFLFLIWIIRRFAFFKKKSLSSSIFLPHVTSCAFEKISDFIQAAVVREDFSEAARWRWRLFLLQQKYSLSKTLFEVFQDEKTNSSYYTLMFYPKFSTKMMYEDFAQWLEIKEKNLKEKES